MIDSSRRTLVAAGLYAVALLLVGLWPTHVDRNVDVIGSPPALWLQQNFDLTALGAYSVIEFSANIALFMPLGLFAMTWSRRSRWLHAVGLGFIVSGAVELTQEIARPGRTASWDDVVANTTGAALGAGLVVMWRRRTAK